MRKERHVDRMFILEMFTFHSENLEKRDMYRWKDHIRTSLRGIWHEVLNSVINLRVSPNAEQLSTFKERSCTKMLVT
jgi:hypothetical protein